MKWQIFMRIPPVAKARARVTKKGAFNPRKTELAQHEIRFCLNSERAPKFSGPLAMTLVFSFIKPAGVPRKRNWPTVKPDLDNLIKMVCDSANTILYDDDKQVVRVTAEKIYSYREGIDLTIETIEAET